MQGHDHPRGRAGAGDAVTSGMEASEARAILLREHDDLRRLLERVRLAAATERGALPMLLSQLSVAFTDHNTTEESLLGPLLRLDYAWGPPRVEHMVEEHAGEHAALRVMIGELGADDPAGITRMVDLIEAQMDDEERTLLALKVLRDDPVGQASG